MSDAYEIIEFDLPWPPSVNHYWGQRVVGKRAIRYLGAKGKKFRVEVEEAVKPQLVKCKELFHNKERIVCEIKVFSPDRRRRDIDNLLKSTLDALEHAGAYEDDAQIDGLIVSRDISVVEPTGRIRVKLQRLRSITDETED